METILYFVRHGHVENPKNIVYARLPRFRLSASGKEQAFQAAEALKNKTLTAIYTSPMLRARQTANIIALNHPRIPIHVSSLINENFTPFQGVSFDEIARRNGDIFTGVEPPFEQPADLLKRSLKFISIIRRSYEGKEVIAVTHGDIVRVIIRWALRYPPEKSGDELPFPGTGSVTALIFSSSNQEIPNLNYLIL